jgi:small subunit ribosomal protein S3
MSVVKHFVDESIKKTEIDEFLQNELENAGYGGVDISKTPLGTHIVVHAMRPGVVIGRGGETIKDLANVLESKFGLPSPQISVAEIEIPELNAFVIASRVASALKRGVHYRRSGYWALNQVMEAGALGVEIIISGKLRGQRAKYEKFRAGYLPKSGEPPLRYMRSTELHVQLKPGIFGVKVRLMPPQSDFPDKVRILELKPMEEAPAESPKEEIEAVEAAEAETEVAAEAEAEAEQAKKPESQQEGAAAVDEGSEDAAKEGAG